MADRLMPAAQALDAPARSGGLTGDSGSSGGVVFIANCTTPGISSAYSGKAATALVGSSGRMSRRRSGDSSSDTRARSTSFCKCDDSCSAISLMMATESAGCQGAMGWLNNHISGAPRPSATVLTRASQALTPALYASSASRVSASCASTDRVASPYRSNRRSRLSICRVRSPNSSDNRPCAVRRSMVICHSRSCACA